MALAFISHFGLSGKSVISVLQLSIWELLLYRFCFVVSFMMFFSIYHGYFYNSMSSKGIKIII